MASEEVISEGDEWRLLKGVPDGQPVIAEEDEEEAGTKHILQALKKSWPSVEDREKARKKRIEEAEKLPTVFPFAPASWDAVKVRSEEEVERDAANAALNRFTGTPADSVGSLPPQAFAGTEEFFTRAREGMVAEEWDPGFFGTQRTEEFGRAELGETLQPFSFTGTPPPTLVPTESPGEGASPSPVSFVPTSVDKDSASQTMAGPASTADVDAASSISAFSFTAPVPSASGGGGVTFCPSPATAVTPGWGASSQPLTFGVGVSECVGDLDPDEEESIQALRLQMPTYSFSSVVSGKSKQHQLEAAVAANDVEEVRKLAPTLSPEEISTRNWSLETPIVVAAKAEQWEIVEILANAMEKKELNYSDASGRTALNWAARHGNVRILKLLLNKVQPEGKELSAIDQQVVSLKNRSGESPVHSAVLGGKAESLRVLVNHVAVCQLNLENADGETPLALCANCDPEAELARILVEALPSESVIVRSFRGSTALDAAIAAKNGKVTELLIDSAPVEAVGYIFPDGSSHMHPACSAGHVFAVKKLIDKVPGIVVASNGGPVPPIALAASRGYEEIVDLLLKDLTDIPEAIVEDEHAGRTSAAILAAEKGYEGIAMKIITTQGCFNFPHMLAIALGRPDSKFIRFMLQLPAAGGAVFFGHHKMQHELPKAPLENIELCLEAFPSRHLSFLDFRASGEADIPPPKLRRILEAARRTAGTDQDFIGTLDAALEFSLRVRSKELFKVCLDFHTDDLCDGLMGRTPGAVNTCICAGSVEFLSLALESLPERAFVDEHHTTCSVFCAALPRADALQMLLDFLPRSLWTLPQFGNDDNVVLASCHSASSGDYDCLSLILEYFTEEEILLPNGLGVVLTHLSWLLPTDALEIIAEKLSIDAFLLADKSGWTPLHWAASKGRERQVNWLIERLPLRAKAMRDLLGQTPLDVAKGMFTNDPSEKMKDLLTVQPKAALRKG